MAKTEIQGKVVSNKMDKSVIVAVERQTRHGLYGKQQRLTSRFVAHDESNELGIGDEVVLVATRPMSRRKRWAVTRVVRKGRIV